MVPFLDLQAQMAEIRADVDAALKRVLDSCRFVLGPEVEAFENEFSEFSQCKNSIAVNSGTSALHLALLSLGIGPGDEVVTVSMTFVATVAAIRYTGATPVFVDVEPGRYTMDPSQLEAAITTKTKAIIPVHLYGQAADMDPILEVAAKHKIPVIEDAAQAHGALYKGKAVGSMGDLGCFSFYPGKNLGACGEGGLVTTNNEDLAATLRSLRDWGQNKRYHHQLKGYNYRMDAFQGAILRIKLRHLRNWTQARQKHAARYRDLLKDSPITLPTEFAVGGHVYHIFAVRHPQRDALQKHLGERGVHSGLHYPFPVHTLEAHADLGYEKGQFPVSEKLAAEELSLPMFAELKDEQLIEVQKAIECWSYDE